MKRKKITIEIITGQGNDFNFKYEKEAFKFFNFRVAKIEDLSERQRVIFLKKHDNKIGNISELKFLMKEIEIKLNEVLQNERTGI